MKVLGYDSEIGAYTPSAVLIMGKTIPEKRIWVWFGYDSDHLLAINSTQQQSRPIPEKQKNPRNYGVFLEMFGGQGRDRTGDTRIFSPLLYELSYLATSSVKVENGRSAGIRTLDPVIKSHLLYQLSYAPIHQCFLGARNGTRTRDNHLGKVALYQLS